MKRGDPWPIIFAAMGDAAIAKDPELAEAAAQLVVAHTTADAARHRYEALATHMARVVGLPDPIEDEPESAPTR